MRLILAAFVLLALSLLSTPAGLEGRPVSDPERTGQSCPEFGQSCPEFGQSCPEFGQSCPEFMWIIVPGVSFPIALRIK